MPHLRLQLQDIQTLAEEIRTLTAAGLPLEGHLADAARGRGRRLQILTDNMARRLEQGESLTDIVREEKSGPGRMLAAAVAAGIHSGNLTDTVEMLGNLAGDLIDIYARLVRALLYPLFICLIASILFLLAVRGLLRDILEILADSGVHLHDVFFQLYVWDTRYSRWLWIIPGLLAAVLLVWLVGIGGRSLSFRGADSLFLLIPGMRGLVRDIRFYTLTHMIGLLTERQLPLPEALLLAGAAVGDRKLEQACVNESERIRLGQPPKIPDGLWRPGQLPPLLHACLTQHEKEDGSTGIDTTGIAEQYRQRVQWNLIWLQHIVPGVLLLGFGGTAAVCYTLALIWPIGRLYDSLSGF